MAGRLILIGGWTRLYKKAKQCGFEITLIHDKARISAEDWGLVDQLITLPMDAEQVPAAAALMHQRAPFDCVVSMQELGLLNAALVKEQLGIQGNDLRPVLLTRDKLKMREHLRDAGLPSIPFQMVAAPREAIDFADRYGWPIMLKPAFGTGSIQVHKIDAATGVAAALSAIQQHGYDQVLAERYVAGREISVEAFSWAGQHRVVALTDKVTTGAPHFVEVGHSVPAALPAVVEAQVRQLTVAFLDSIGHVLGPSHTELILGQDGPVIVESHTRAGGDFIYDLVEIATGVDLFMETFQGLAGSPATATPSLGRAAVIRYLQLPAGRVSEITGQEQARATEGVVRCDIPLKVGQRIAPITNSYERYGCLIASGATVAEALATVEQAQAQLSVRIDKDAA